MSLQLFQSPVLFTPTINFSVTDDKLSSAMIGVLDTSNKLIAGVIESMEIRTLAIIYRRY